jgi:hypothetical protein
MEGTIVALGIGTGFLGLVHPGFRPIAIVALAFGALVAVVLVWRRGRESHPTISRHADHDSEAHKPIEPE